jgi:hypothetical protein
MLDCQGGDTSVGVYFVEPTLFLGRGGEIYSVEVVWLFEPSGASV